MEGINLDVLTRPFDPAQIKQHEGRGGKVLDYLETHAVITRLNEAFAGAWSFEVLDFKTMEGEIVVHGKLTAVGITKTQFGSSEVHRLKGQDGEKGAPLSIGDDLKAAASDALKKCATLFGVGLELYRKPDRPACLSGRQAQRPPAARQQPEQSGPRGDRRTPQERPPAEGRPMSTSPTPARSGSEPAARQPVSGRVYGQRTAP